MIQNYSQLVDRISRSSGLAVEDIERRIEAKRAKLSGLISKEGAAQVVASELGISFDKEKMKISELLSGMKRANLVGKIIEMFPVREYNKNDKHGKIGSFVIADETGNIRTVLWDVNHIALIEKNEIKLGDIVEITNGAVRNDELHLTGFSDIKMSNEILGEVKTEKVFGEKRISDLKQGDRGELRAVIVQIFEPRFFQVCPLCGKSVGDTGECQEHGKVAGERRVLLNLVLDDGTSSIRAVLFSEQVSKLIGGEPEGELFSVKRQELLGKEMNFAGQARQNRVYDNLEFSVSNVGEIDIDRLIEKLERQNL